MVGGPISSLRFGYFLCCLEKEENRNARNALSEFHRLGRQVEWHTGPSKVQQASGFVMKLFGSSSSSTSMNDRPPTRSQLIITDATNDNINEGNPFPQLQIKPISSNSSSGDNIGSGDGDEYDDEENNTKPTKERNRIGGLMKQNALGYQLDIPLHRIVSVEQVEATMMVIISKDIHSTDERKKNKEAARISFQSSMERDAVCMDLKVLVEWNKQRQPDMEEELPGEGLRAKAQKAAHFARREIEMRETKRNREQRKAKFMAGCSTGGLKYTAMAMANRAQES